MIRDLRFAVRRLLRSPGFSATVILLFGLTIGANASLFSVLYGLLYKPLPFPDAERLIVLDARLTNMALAFDVGMSVPLFEAAATQARTLDALAAYRSRDAELRSAVGAGQAIETFHAAFVQPALFTLLGTQPLLGRLIADEDARRGAARSALISWQLWQSRYAGGSNVIGSTLALADGDYRIVGVLPRGFTFPNATVQVWLPLQFSEAERAPAQAGSFGDLNVVARLAPSATPAGVDGELAGLARSLPGLKEIVDLVGLKISAQPLRSLWLGDRQPALKLMLLAVALVLLVTAANICNLYIARLLNRRHELAVLDALGAGPWRRLRQTAAETIALSGSGALVGIALLVPGLELLRHFDLLPADAPQGIGLDAVTIAFVAALAVLLALIMTVSSLWLQNRGSTLEIRIGARQTWGRAAQRVRQTLIVAQIALTAALLVGVGLLLRSSQRLLAEDVGFERDHLAITAINDLPRHEPGVAADAPGLASAQAATRAFVERCRAVPGVIAVALATVAPFGWSMSVGNFSLPDENGRDAAKQPTANRAYVGADYFIVLGTPLLRGRAFSAEETRTHAAVAIVDAQFAKQAFGDRDPLGQTFSMGDDDTPSRRLTIVGVAPTLKLQALDETPQRPTVFQPDEYPANAMLLLRTRADPAALAAPVRDALRAAAPQARLRDVVTMRERIAETLRDRLRLNTLLELLGVMALTLAAVGLYAVLAYAVRMRAAEFGVRMALGASPRSVLAIVLAQGARLIVIGLLLAVPLAWLLARVLAARLYQVGAFDPLTLAGVGVLLAAISLIACWLPARRASRVDPIEALRHE